MVVYVAYNDANEPYDYFDSYLVMSRHKSSMFKSYKRIELPDEEYETVQRYMLSKTRLNYLLAEGDKT